MKYVSVTLELEPQFLRKIEALAKTDRRATFDQAAFLFEKGVRIFEMQQHTGTKNKPLK
jgi:hypothetical protein